MDHNFVTDSRQVFERYYPGRNLYMVNSPTQKLKMIKDSSGFEILDMYDKSNYATVRALCLRHGVDRIVLHGMRDYMLPLLMFLKKSFDFKVYWIFWGYELYETLCYERGYRLLDETFSIFDRLFYYTPNRFSKVLRKLTANYRPGAFAKLFGMIDYFCFWNKRDYDLLKVNFKTDAEFRFFAYSANETGQQPESLFRLRERKTACVQINHQASLFGNHGTVFRRLAEIDPTNSLVKLVPLSYGHRLIRERTLRTGKSMFGDKFRPVLGYMPQDEYFDMLDKVDVAIFGQRRQEASGNIIQLLRNGVKVFLRNDNNLLYYYREKGYLIFSFEDDLKDIRSVEALSIEEQQHNRDCFMRNRLYYDNFMPSLFNQ